MNFGKGLNELISPIQDELIIFIVIKNRLTEEIVLCINV